MNEKLKYIIIDNIFDDPEKIIQISKEVKFYSSKTKNPVNANGDIWKGYRSQFLQQHHKQRIFVEVTHKILNELNVYGFFDREKTFFDISTTTQAAFHYTPEEYKFEYTDQWVHSDPAFLYSGVIYLQKNPPKNTGTILFDDNSEIVVENKFNRLIFYRSDVMHTPQNGFGTTLEDSRLVLLFFIDGINLIIQREKWQTRNKMMR